MRSEANGHLQVQVPTRGGGFGANYAPTRVCNVSEPEKLHEPESVNELVRFNGKRAPSKAFNLSQIGIVLLIQRLSGPAPSQLNLMSTLTALVTL